MVPHIPFTCLKKSIMPPWPEITDEYEMTMVRSGLLAMIAIAIAAHPALAAGSAEDPDATSKKPPRYAAVAVAEQSRHYGFAYNQPTRALAYKLAMEQCIERAKARDCLVRLWSTSCLAFARSTENGSWGADWAENPRTAGKGAMAACGQYSTTCRVEFQVCNGE